MTQRDDPKIRHLALICLVLVAYIHATTFRYCPVVEPDDAVDRFNRGFQSSIAFGFARIAVPYFFLVSGFLFFRTAESMPQLWVKIRRRFFGLVVPYLCWSALWLVVVSGLVSFGIDVAGRIQPFESHTPIAWANTLFLDPIPGQLWFVRDLICLSLLSPLIFVLLRSCGPLLPIITCSLWFVVPDNVVIEQRAWWEWVSLTGMSMFTLGGWLSQTSTPRLDSTKVCICAAVLWILVIVATLLNPIPALVIEDAGVRLFLDRTGILLGIVCVYSGYRHFARVFAHPLINECSRHTFFVYAAHYPLLGLLVASGLRIFGGAAMTQVLVFLLTPLLVVAVLSLLAIAMSRRLPHLYGLFSGYRGLTPRSTVRETSDG